MQTPRSRARGPKRKSSNGPRAVTGKKITESQMIGQKGVNLIEQIVLSMGFTWTPTGNLEAGIDGFVEIRDPVTGEMTNNILQVQSKATEEPFTVETAEGFEYPCTEQDIHYWMAGNAPVILIRSRPSTEEAYWISVKDYFKDPAVRRTCRIKFHKQRNRFDEDSRDDIASLAVPKDAGFYLAPRPKTEDLTTNLMTINGFADRVYMAETQFRTPGALWEELKRLGGDFGGEWILKAGRIISFRDLSEYPWREICDIGTIEDFDTREWSESEDPDKKSEFLWLLDRALSQKIGKEVRYDKEKECWYFKPRRDLLPRRISYQSHNGRTSAEVVRPLRSRKDPNKISYYRHAAFGAKFLRLEGKWYLEITPTFYFTWNGYEISPYYENLLTGIKRLQRNLNVLGQLRMWADYLTRPGDLITPEYPYLKFGELATVEMDAGINDDHWLHHEDPSEQVQASTTDVDMPQLELFEP